MFGFTSLSLKDSLKCLEIFGILRDPLVLLRIDYELFEDSLKC